jgi:DNA-binding CsgD family transcriptional regulator
MTTDRWPLVGRAATLDRLVALLTGRQRGPSALVVAGAAGVGKTRLMARARAEADRAGVRVHWAVGSAAGTPVPFGPFAHLLPAAEPGARRAPLTVTEMLTVTAARLTGSGPRQAVCVDDAHLVDPASAALVAHLVTNTSVPVVMTVRGDGPEPPWLRDVARIDLRPLDAEEVAEVVQARLGDPAEAALLATVARLSEGNPLLLRELVEAGLAGGAIARRERVWCAVGPIVAAAGLPGQIAARLDRLPAPLRAAAELVALAEPADAALLERLIPAELREALDRERLLSAVAGPAGLGLAHPLYGEALRATVPPLRAREHRRRLAEAAEPADDPIRIAVWRLDAGLPVAPAALTAAARDASAALDHALAGRLAWAAVEAADGSGAEAFDAELVLLGELPYQGRTADALTRAAGLAERAPGPRERAALARVRANLHLIAGDPAAARATLDEAVASAPDRPLRLALELNRAGQAFATGRVALSLELGDAVLAEYGDGADVVPRLALARVRALACAGRTADAEALARRALALIEPADPAGRALAATVAMTLLQALALDGRTAEAMAVGEAGLAEAAANPAAPLRAFWTHELGQVGLLVGHPRTARRWLRETLAVMPLQGVPASLQLWGLDGLAEAAALLGDATDAARQEQRLKAALPGGFQAHRRGGAVWAAAAAGELSRARDLARAHARDLADAGAALMAGWVLHDAARLGGGSDVAAWLGELAAAGQSALLRAMAAHAAALAEADPHALDAVAQTFAALGCDLFTAEAATRAASLHRHAGRPGAALSSAALADRAVSRCEGARTPLLARAGTDLDGLTGREREVVGLAARGLADREIAARLHLSVRTVGSHLYRAYRKLGITDRSQLPPTLGE